MKWQTYTRGTIHPHRIDMPMRSMAELGPTIGLAPIQTVLYLNKGDKLWWSWDAEEIGMLSRRLLNFAHNHRARRTHLETLDRLNKKAFIIAEHIRELDLSALSDDEIIGLYRSLYEESKEAHALANAEIDAIDLYPVEHLHELISKQLSEGISPEEKQKVILALSTPAYLSYISKEEMALLSVAIGVRDGWNPEKVRGALDNIEREYWWTSLGWELMEIKTPDDFRIALKTIQSQSESPQDKLESLIRHAADVRINREKLLSRYRLPQEIASLIELFDVYASYHDTRKEMQMKTTYAAYLLMREVARRRNYAPDMLEWLLHDEVINLLRGEELDEGLVEGRKKIIGLYIHDGAMHVSSGQEAEDIFKKEFSISVDSASSIKGFVASRGTVRGPVKVCNGGVEALLKIEVGDILVTGMTMPDYLPAMKRAAAIVTDEGGITCHAAIISRELKKPCIIGTKVATQVLHDGDLVEVDAEKGIVRIISKNEG